MVEALPDSKMATYTFRPSGLVHSALGRSPSIGTVATRWRVSGSKTSTAFSIAHETNARSGSPAKTTSAGASKVGIVASTCSFARSTMLTESETWLTTQTSFEVRNRTETGSRPTGTLPMDRGATPVTSKTSRRASGRLQTTSVERSGLRATRLTGAVSKLTNEGSVRGRAFVFGRTVSVATWLVIDP